MVLLTRSPWESPLNSHVLSLLQAFIRSQDQTHFAFQDFMKVMNVYFSKLKKKIKDIIFALYKNYINESKGIFVVTSVTAGTDAIASVTVSISPGACADAVASGAT